MKNPIVQTLLRRRFQKPEEVAWAKVRNERQASTGYVFIDEKPTDGSRQEAQRIQLIETVMDLPRDKAEERDRQALGSGLTGVWMLEFGAEEGSDVGARLRDDEVIDVEEFGDAGEWRLSVGVAGVFPGAKSDVLSGGPGDDCTGFIFAFEKDWGVHCRG